MRRCWSDNCLSQNHPRRNVFHFYLIIHSIPSFPSFTMKKDKYYILFLGACVLSAMFTFLLTMTINSIDVPQSPNQQGLRHGYVNPVVSPPPVPPPSPPSSPPPCILIRSATTPSFRLCTLDPELDKWSLLARTTAPSLLVHWPLKALLKTILQSVTQCPSTN